MIKYTLPDFTNGLALNLFFIRLFQTQPEWFITHACIDSVYGCFPSCIMNGGRSFIKERYSAKQIEQTFALLHEHGVTARLTFTNMLVNKNHLKDEYVALILSIAQSYPVEIIVYSDEILEELKNNYGFACVLSTTRGISEISELNAALKKYDYVVLDYNMNKNTDFIKGIENPGKVEIMVNEYCRPHCPYREQHYLQNSADQIEGVAHPFYCSHQDGGEFFRHREGHPIYMTNNEILYTNNEFGISYFKIVGRGIAFETVLESYVYYLIKPLYRGQVKQMVRYPFGRQ